MDLPAIEARCFIGELSQAAAAFVVGLLHPSMSLPRIRNGLRSARFIGVLVETTDAATNKIVVFIAIIPIQRRPILHRNVNQRSDARPRAKEFRRRNAIIVNGILLITMVWPTSVASPAYPYCHYV